MNIEESGPKKLVLLNAEAKVVQKLVKFRCESAEVCVYDSNNSSLDIQIFPLHNITGHSKIDTSQFQVLMVFACPKCGMKQFFCRLNYCTKYFHQLVESKQSDFLLSETKLKPAGLQLLSMSVSSTLI